MYGRRGALVAACVGLGIVSCFGAVGSAPKGAPFVSLVISVSGDSTSTRVKLMDLSGRASGWLVDGPTDQVPGCLYTFGEFGGELLSRDDGVNAGGEPAAGDSAGRSDWGMPPEEHVFQLGGPTAPGDTGLIERGRCELWVTAVQSGPIRLLAEGRTSTSTEPVVETVRASMVRGRSYGWRVEWGARVPAPNVRFIRLAGDGQHRDSAAIRPQRQAPRRTAGQRVR